METKEELISQLMLWETHRMVTLDIIKEKQEWLVLCEDAVSRLIKKIHKINEEVENG